MVEATVAVTGEERVASLSLVDEVLTVRRIEVGLVDLALGGPRETVATAICSEPVPLRGRVLVEQVMSAIISCALVAVARWLRLVDILIWLIERIGVTMWRKDCLRNREEGVACGKNLFWGLLRIWGLTVGDWDWVTLT